VRLSLPVNLVVCCQLRDLTSGVPQMDVLPRKQVIHPLIHSLVMWSSVSFAVLGQNAHSGICGSSYATLFECKNLSSTSRGMRSTLYALL
jgi:hypothetical protein